MKIMHCIGGLPNGGAEKLVVELANEMSKFHEVILCSFRDMRSEWIFPSQISKRVKLVTFGKKEGPDVRIFYKIFKLLKKEKPDIINIHIESTYNYLLPFTIIFKKITFFNTIHNTLHADRKRKYTLYNCLGFITLRIKNICITQSISDIFSSKFRNLEFTLIPNGIKRMCVTDKFQIVQNELDNYKKRKKNILFLAVGSITPQKNYKLLLETFAQLEDQSIQLLIIGEDTTPNKMYMSELEKIQPSNVTFIGRKNNVIDYLKLVDCFIMSSVYEGLPIAVLEALSVGCPVVCTPAGGLVDIIKDTVNGFISEDFSKDNLLLQVKRFLASDPKAIETISDNNISDFKEKYSIEKCADAYLELYNHHFNNE